MTDREKLDDIARIILAVENRCLAADGPVTPTLQEMTEEEMRQIWRLTQTDREQALAALKKAGWWFSHVDCGFACDVYIRKSLLNRERIAVPRDGSMHMQCRVEMDVPPKDLPPLLSPVLADETTALRLLRILGETRARIEHLGAAGGSTDGYYRHIEELEADSRALRIAIKALGGEVTE